MRDLIRRNPWSFAGLTAAALMLRAIFLAYFPGLAGDSFVYGDIAKNWLQHGIYGLSGVHAISPTYIRLPGYPAFLALIFSVFGMEHYRAVLVVQIIVDLGTCFICARIALRLCGPRAARIAFALAGLCPFLANYAAAALTETLEIFFTALALDLAISALERQRPLTWFACGLSCGCATLLRPDGAMLPFVLIIYLLWRTAVVKTAAGRKQLLRAGAVLATGCVLLLVPWTIRNWFVFHAFQPLAPRYANEQGDFVPMGFNRWVKTWMVDYASVEEIYWQVPGQSIDATKLPSRAFDGPEQLDQTARLIEDYNAVLRITPQLDKRFQKLAVDRIDAHPIRYYIALPLLRITDMWLRPRTEMLPSDTRWWEFNDEARWSALAVALGGIGLFYVSCGITGWIRNRPLPSSGLFLLFVVLRSALLGTLENPEPRYTLEMYPLLIVVAAAAFISRKSANLTPEASRSF